jgi:hypothetical protein
MTLSTMHSPNSTTSPYNLYCILILSQDRFVKLFANFKR